MTVRTLINELNRLTKLYDEGTPEVSDKEWDDLYFELVQLEKETGEYYEDSPTQRINYEVVNELKKVEHSHPMLSLDKTKDIDDIKSFIGDKDTLIMAKMDGLTCSLKYIDGRLVSAETRGNGIIGEDILHNILQVRNVPKRIPKGGEWIIDGEIICTYDNFKEFENEYKNPRNFASGSIRLLDSKESRNRNLTFIAWDLIKQTWYSNDVIKTLFDKFLYLKSYGFTVVPHEYIETYDEFPHIPPTLEEQIEEIKEECKKLNYPIDGVVFKYDKIEEYEAAGRTDHHFKGGIAYKFYDDEYETILRDIEWTMGRTGQLTPVAIFDTIDIDGTECSRASLHNVSVMRDLLGDAFVSQKVYVFKANMIIPQISRAEEKGKIGDNCYTNAFVIPEICPVCGGETVIKKDNDSEVLCCNNSSCQGKLVNRLDHFCGKKGLDIKGISKATLEKLVEWKWVQGYQDIFLLKGYRNEWIKKQGFGVASVDKILNAIEESKNATLDKVIAAAGIPEIGSRVAKQLAPHYKSWSDFRSETNFLKYDGIGEIMNNNLLNFDYDDLELNYTINLHLHNVERPIEQEEIKNTLEGKVFCVTGKVHIFKNRTELQADIEAKGGKVVSSMSSKVTHLINNDNTSTSAKNKAAQKAGIPILTEEEYLALN